MGRKKTLGGGPMLRDGGTQLSLWDDPTYHPQKPPRRFSNEYIWYLGSTAWACRRRTAIENSGGLCSDCGSQERLEAHHLTYRRFGYEREGDLVAVCHVCHNERHRHKRSDGRLVEILTPALRL